MSSISSFLKRFFIASVVGSASSHSPNGAFPRKRDPARRVPARAHNAIDRKRTAAQAAARAIGGVQQAIQFDLEGRAVRPCEVQRDVLNGQFFEVRRKIFAQRAEAHGHGRRGQLGIVQVIPLVRQLIPTAERPIDAHGRGKITDDQ